ncbi:hypothetical protein TNCV_4180721 [Trichonephila clavipes]|nr:hypothetical protein TNCV_4180721 [Trichonephila clavipes]
MVSFVCLFAKSLRKRCNKIVLKDQTFLKRCFTEKVTKRAAASEARFTSLRVRRREDILEPGENASEELSENESDGSEMSCFNLDSDESIRLHEGDCKESEESADVIDNIPINPDVCYMSLRIAQNRYRIVNRFLTDLRLEMFCDKAVVREAP